jgi:hypothetical protein
MPFEDFDDGRRFWDAWRAVTVERRVEYALFTFGQTELPYYLVLQPSQAGETVTVRRGEVTVDRAQIITPWSEQPEFRDFFDDPDDENLIAFLVARTAAFSNLRLSNHRGSERIVSDSVEEAVAKLNRQLDDEEEDRVAILSAPKPLAGMAVLRYTTERILASTPANLQELRERGLLP